MPSRYILLAALFALGGCGGKFSSEKTMSAVDESGSTTAESTSNTIVGADAIETRKIIYTASIDLVVKDFGEAERRVLELVSEMAGYVAEFREDRRYGGQLGGNWVVRIPVIQFNRFIDQVLELGVPMTRQIDALDVTEQFTDLTARLNNKRKLEERILKLLEEKTDAIKDVIEVESQLGRVREEIETFEGKLRYMSDRIAMTTVTISAREDKSYTPAQAPTFAAKTRNVFFTSLAALRQFGEGIALAIVGAAPWFVLGCIASTPLLIWYRRRRRRR